MPFAVSPSFTHAYLVHQLFSLPLLPPLFFSLLFSPPYLFRRVAIRMIHILRNSRNASDPFIRAVQVLKKKTKLVQIFLVWIIDY